MQIFSCNSIVDYQRYLLYQKSKIGPWKIQLFSGLIHFSLDETILKPCNFVKIATYVKVIGLLVENKSKIIAFLLPEFSTVEKLFPSESNILSVRKFNAIRDHFHSFEVELTTNCSITSL